MTFDPRAANPSADLPLQRPLFVPIVSAASLAQTLARKSNGRVDGDGEPSYGERDVVDLSTMREIGLPFWIAGAAGSPAALEYALSEGANGVQVGTLFAYGDESGFTSEIRARVIDGALNDTLRIRTDVRASPTGYPFKVVVIEADAATPVPNSPIGARDRLCDLGYLREAVRNETGTLDYRCAAEPVESFLSKGGAIEQTIDRQCLCNALCAAIGMPQQRVDGFVEPAVVTSGDDVKHLAHFLGSRTHSAASDVIAFLRSDLKT